MKDNRVEEFIIKMFKFMEQERWLFKFRDYKEANDALRNVLKKLGLNCTLRNWFSDVLMENFLPNDPDKSLSFISKKLTLEDARLVAVEKDCRGRIQNVQV